jgi:hypothetical protein
VDEVLEQWHQLLADSGRHSAKLHSGCRRRRLGASCDRGCQQQEWLDNRHLGQDGSGAGSDRNNYDDNDLHNIPDFHNVADFHDFDLDDDFDVDNVDNHSVSRVILSAVLDCQRLFGGRHVVIEFVAGVGPERIYGEFRRLLPD